MSEEDFEDRDEGDLTWEAHAENAVRQAWDSLEFDEVRGVIEIPNPDEPRYGSTECKDIEELRIALEEAYTNAWYAYVPFDSGEAVFTEDADGYVGDFLTDHRDAEEFFESLRVEDSDEDLYRSDEAVERGESQILRLDLEGINDELIARLAARPELMRELDPRKFEELVAELLRDKGYDVTLTPPSRDGGRDILAVKREDIGSALTLVECKRYAANKRVGVDIVRGLYGVVSADNATRGLIATTSYFTSGARAFRDQVPYRLGLADFEVLRRMLQRFRSHLAE
jgi:hypothetical protein